MKCPCCNSVVYPHKTKTKGDSIERVHHCKKCSNVFITKEKIVSDKINLCDCPLCVERRKAEKIAGEQRKKELQYNSFYNRDRSRYTENIDGIPCESCGSKSVCKYVKEYKIGHDAVIQLNKEGIFHVDPIKCKKYIPEIVTKNQLQSKNYSKIVHVYTEKEYAHGVVINDPYVGPIKAGTIQFTG